MNYYSITFRWYDTNTYCSNIVIAANEDAARKHYEDEGKEVVGISPASEYDVEDAQRRGKPVITVEDTEPAEKIKKPETEYTISINEEFKSTEIKFAEKPAEEIRTALKELSFRWHKVRGVWYGYEDAETVRKALEAVEGVQIEKKERAKVAAVPAFDKEVLTKEFAKAWDSERMIKYCVGKVAEVAELPNGDLITIDKEGIETRFCFGESGYDYDDAARMAAHARTSEDYFKAENMKNFNGWVEDLENAKKTLAGEWSNGVSYVLVIGATAYTGQREDCRLRYISLERFTSVLDACGGSASLEELPGRAISLNGKKNCRVATVEEIEIILAAYKRARAAHEKKVDAYLKRYGLSKVNSWTYWREA